MIISYKSLIAAILLIGIGSAPALAQDDLTQKVKDVVVDQGIDKAKSTAKGLAADKIQRSGTVKVRNPNIVVPDEIKNNGKVIVHNDGMITTQASEKIIFEAPKPVALPVSAPVIAPVPSPVSAPLPSGAPTNCPAGTTGQADGTCMITGNYLG